MKSAFLGQGKEKYGMTTAKGIYNIVKKFVDSLAAATAEEYDISQDSLQDFFQAEFVKQFGKPPRKAGTKEEKEGKSTNGYIIFCGEHRGEVREELGEEATFGSINGRLSEMWKVADKDEYRQRAIEENKKLAGNAVANSKKPAAKPLKTGVQKTVGKGTGKKAEKVTEKKAEKKVSGKGEKKAEKKAEKGTEKKVTGTVEKKAEKKASTGPNLVRNTRSGRWVISGTTLVVQSSSDKTVIGRLVGSAMIALSPTDIKKCQTNGWEYSTTAIKESIKKPSDQTESNDEDSD